MRLRHIFIPCAVCLATALTCFAEPCQEKSSPKHENVKEPELFKNLQGRQNRRPKIAIDSAGNAVAVWIHQHRLMTAVRSANQTEWTQPKILAESKTNFKSLQLIHHANGIFAAIWSQKHEKETTVFVTTLTDVQLDWTVPVPLSNIHHCAVNPVLAMNSSGEMLAAWQETPGVVSVIKYAKYTKNNGWLPPAQASSTDRHAYFPRVTLDEQGNGAVMWVRKAPEAKPVIEIARLPSDGSWVAPEDLGDFGFYTISQK